MHRETAPANSVIVDWQCVRLHDLPALALHRIMRARQEVFVVEQQCIYLDADAADESSWHVTGWAVDGQVLAYARLVDPGIKYAEASMGRVITPARSRGTGKGREVVRRAVAQSALAYPGVALRISAQSRLEHFYASFGFVVVGEGYLEDGIPHTEMLRAADLN